MRKNSLAHRPLAQHFELPRIRHVPHEKRRPRRVTGVAEALAAYRDSKRATQHGHQQ